MIFLLLFIKNMRNVYNQSQAVYCNVGSKQATLFSILIF